MLRLVTDDVAGEELAATVDEICREGARRILVAALELEAGEYAAALEAELDEQGHRLVVRNGHARPRTITTVAGAIEIRAPRVNDRRVDPETGKRTQFKSSIVPPWCRKSPKVTEVLPLLYLHGLSTGDFVPALEGFFGSAAGLSASAITRLTTQWQDEHRAFMNRSLADRDFVYVWVDGVHFNVRLEEERLCCLVMVGVRLDGTKELIAVKDGYRESTDSWGDLLRDLKRRGMRAPMVAVGDGALGFWAALRDVWPETREQRDWVSIKWRTPSMPCRSRSSRQRRRCWPRSETPRTASTRWRQPGASTPSSRRSGPRPRPRSATTWTASSPSTTSPSSTGSI